MTIVICCEPRRPHTYHFEVWRDDRPAPVAGGVVNAWHSAFDVISAAARTALAVDAWYAS